AVAAPQAAAPARDHRRRRAVRDQPGADDGAASRRPWSRAVGFAAVFAAAPTPGYRGALAQANRRRRTAAMAHRGEVDHGADEPEHCANLVAMARAEHAMKLSAAEIGSLWSPPTEATADRIERVVARWIDAPSKAFVSPDDPRNLIFGLGK